jgi:hypothetical protein
LVKNAISVLCRLGFVKKRASGLENQTFHPSWQGGLSSSARSCQLFGQIEFLFFSMSTSIAEESLAQGLADLSASFSEFLNALSYENLPFLTEQIQLTKIKCFFKKQNLP